MTPYIFWSGFLLSILGFLMVCAYRAAKGQKFDMWGRKRK